MYAVVPLIKTTPASMQFDFKAQNTPYYRSATSIVQGAEFAIEDAGVPCTTRELLEVLPKYGKVPGGINPATNLSNNLSSDFRFRSVMYRGNSAWWLVKMGDPPA